VIFLHPFFAVTRLAFFPAFSSLKSLYETERLRVLKSHPRAFLTRPTTFFPGINKPSRRYPSLRSPLTNLGHDDRGLFALGIPFRFRRWRAFSNPQGIYGTLFRKESVGCADRLSLLSRDPLLHVGAVFSLEPFTPPLSLPWLLTPERADQS